MRYYRKRQAYDRCPWGDSKSYELVRAGKLPGPVAYLGPKLPIWDADVWDAALDALIAKAAAEPAPDIVAEARRVRQERQAGRAQSASRSLLGGGAA